MTTKTLKDYLIITDGPGRFQVLIESLPTSAGAMTNEKTPKFKLRQRPIGSEEVSANLVITGYKHFMTSISARDKLKLKKHDIFSNSNFDNIIFICGYVSGFGNYDNGHFAHKKLGLEQNSLRMEFTALYDLQKRCGLFSPIHPDMPRIKIIIPEDYPFLPIFAHNFFTTSNIDETRYTKNEAYLRIVEEITKSDITEISKNFLIYLLESTEYFKKDITLTIDNPEFFELGKQVFQDVEKIELIKFCQQVSAKIKFYAGNFTYWKNEEGQQHMLRDRYGYTFKFTFNQSVWPKELRYFDKYKKERIAQ